MASVAVPVGAAFDIDPTLVLYATKNASPQMRVNGGAVVPNVEPTPQVTQPGMRIIRP